MVGWKREWGKGMERLVGWMGGCVDVAWLLDGLDGGGLDGGGLDG